MRLKIKIKLFPGATVPKIIDKGEWIDLCSNEGVAIRCPQAHRQRRVTKEGEVVDRYRNVTFGYQLIPLGVAMQLPKGFEANVLPRSSTFKNFGVILCNSEGIIDNSYCGNNDEWKFGAIALKDSQINAGDRICQFRIVLSQKASVWQKLKWLFTSGIEFVQVDSLDNKDRNGIGSTGIR